MPEILDGAVSCVLDVWVHNKMDQAGVTVILSYNVK